MRFPFVLFHNFAFPQSSLFTLALAQNGSSESTATVPSHPASTASISILSSFNHFPLSSLSSYFSSHQHLYYK